MSSSIQVVPGAGHLRLGHASCLGRFCSPRRRAFPADRASSAPTQAGSRKALSLTLFILCSLQGIAGGLMAATAGSIPLSFPLKWRFVVGCFASAGGALMLAFADSSSDYWRLIVHRSELREPPPEALADNSSRSISSLLASSARPARHSPSSRSSTLPVLPFFWLTYLARFLQWKHRPDDVDPERVCGRRRRHLQQLTPARRRHRPERLNW